MRSKLLVLTLGLLFAATLNSSVASAASGVVVRDVDSVCVVIRQPDGSVVYIDCPLGPVQENN
jgi:hypothetical protein